MSYVEFYRAWLQVVCWLFNYSKLNQAHAIHTYISYYFTLEVCNLHILLLWELQSLATYATTGAMPLDQ